MLQRTPQTPFQIYESIITNLPAGVDRINLLQRDQELILNGWTIHYAIDPHEIGRFCFPFDPHAMVKELRPSKVQEVSRHQNGRYEAIYNLTRPIMLKEYDEELERNFSWIRKTANAFDDDEVVLGRYLAALHLSPNSGPEETKEIIEELTDKDIGSLIAIVTGILHIGVRRLNEISNKRLMRGHPEGVDRAARFDKREEVRQRIEQVLRQYFTEHAEQFEGAHSELVDPHFREGIIKARVLTDSRALDELLWLNERYNPEKHLILYLSSTAKSLELDKDSSPIKDLLPQVNGESYPLVRTPDDLFVYMIYKGNSNDEHERAQNARDSFAKLNSLLKQISESRDRFKSINEHCLHCNVDSGEALCEYGSECEGIREYGEAIRDRQYRNVNMSLQLRLAELMETTQPQPHHRSHQDILDAVSRTLAEHSPKAEERRMNFLMNVSLTKASFVSALRGPDKAGQNVKVSCYLNNFPTKLQVENPDLRAIVDHVVSLLKAWNETKYQDAVGQYLKFDANLDQNAESELVRSFLYLIMGKPAEASKVGMSFLEEKKLAEPLLREFHYLLGFSLWQEGKYEEALRFISESCRLYPEDGRFFHCRSVIVLDLLTLKAKGQVTQEPSLPQTVYTYQNIIDDTLHAIERFSGTNNLLMSAVCHNNAAYYLSDPQFAMVDIEKSDHHFGEMMKLVPESDWDPFYPEFFHTKGCVLYARFLTSPAEKRYLKEAHDAALNAQRLYPEKEEHDDLLKRLDTALKVRV